MYTIIKAQSILNNKSLSVGQVYKTWPITYNKDVERTGHGPKGVKKMYLVNGVVPQAYCPACGKSFPVGPMADKEILAGRPGHCATAGYPVAHHVSPDKAYRPRED